MAKEKKEDLPQEVGTEIPAKNETRQSLVSGAQFHDFDEHPVFRGRYNDHKILREKDGADGQKKGDLMGFSFDDEEGNEVIIGNSHSIIKAIENPLVQKGSVLEIEFLGKGETSTGKPFNRFKIDLIS